MWLALRQFISIAALPGTMAVFIPLWITSRYAVEVTAPRTLVEFAWTIAGGVFGLAGLALFAACLHRFWIDGRGTLAPWDPPRRLVVVGPYRYVRNPMISGVILVLIAEALVLRSGPHGWWAVTFAAINATYIPLLEEPMLEVRFGEAYREYCRHVPRLVPRVRPWPGPADQNQ